MPAAARVGDITSHLGTPLGPGPGSSTVKIGGMPAWRAGVDFHACTASDGPAKPHTGGTVAIGSSKVFINKCAAVRKGDQVVEAGPGNAITTGCERVQIGG